MISKYFDFGQIFETIRFWSKFSKIFDFFEIFEKISILVKFSKNFDFGQIFEKISILVKIFEKNCDFFKNFEIFRFWSNFRNNSI